MQSLCHSECSRFLLFLPILCVATKVSLSTPFWVLKMVVSSSLQETVTSMRLSTREAYRLPAISYCVQGGFFDYFSSYTNIVVENKTISHLSRLFKGMFFGQSATFIDHICYDPATGLLYTLSAPFQLLVVSHARTTLFMSIPLEKREIPLCM